MSSAAPISLRGLLWLLALQLISWGVLPGLLVESLPLDVVEGVYWGQEWQWGYYKHPPLPAWVVYLFEYAIGDVGPFLLSQICIGLTLLCVWNLGCRLLDKERAAFGVMALLGVYFFTWPTIEFNHNVAQMPIWAAAVLLFHRATMHGRWVDWLLLGLLSGLGLLTKYSFIMLLAAMFLWLALHPTLRMMLRKPQPWLGVLVMLAVFLPHLLWLIAHDFLPFSYASARSAAAAATESRWLGPLKFLLVQLVDHMPLLLLLLIAGFWRPRCWQYPVEGSSFLFWVGLMPAVLTVLGAMITGAGTRDMWGAPMWNLSGLILASMIPLEVLRERWHRLRWAFALFLMLLGVLMLLFVGFKDQIRNKPSRTGWPDQALADSLLQQWQQHTECPLQLVAGDYWLAEMVAITLSPRASAIPDADKDLAPWVDLQRVQQQGVMLLSTRQYSDVDTLELGEPDMSGEVVVSWPRLPEHEGLKVRWFGWMPDDCRGAK
ncbi:glycosyltransferase family 39 protein [Marinobacterium sediminicola]|uniref:4-amino-4-deoxy-L-arabinose transferase n=1 Tax=Marinobacterium sediminicola TaxID=518898 RepID=A0ABY1RZ70_9GAMM|nr:glycosyltransferase family 39 protein [Marinobacterium sediminicola]ULG69093.1 glycosyltransferase family 39 protein [Marinobacterium sediminicola]SMR73629.1 4-amino-4-deoxy-L-arabinose transferase [Marinobacterium sediminicola]